MKFVLLFLALASSALADSHEYRRVTHHDDGSFTVHDPTGKQITVRSQEHHGHHVVEIHVTGPQVPTRKIIIDTQVAHHEDQDKVNYRTHPRDWEHDETIRPKRSEVPVQRQFEVLGKIFHEYKEQLEASDYEEILNHIAKAVARGQLHPVVLHVFRSLVEEHLWEDLVRGRGVFFGYVADEHRHARHHDDHHESFYGPRVPIYFPREVYPSYRHHEWAPRHGVYGHVYGDHQWVPYQHTTYVHEVPHEVTLGHQRDNEHGVELRREHQWVPYQHGIGYVPHGVDEHEHEHEHGTTLRHHEGIVASGHDNYHFGQQRVSPWSDAPWRTYEHYQPNHYGYTGAQYGHNVVY